MGIFSLFVISTVHYQ
ncbi:23S rRNA methylase leader peptide ErmCL, partial [Staphylococcus aureus]